MSSSAGSVWRSRTCIGESDIRRQPSGITRVKRAIFIGELLESSWAFTYPKWAILIGRSGWSGRALHGRPFGTLGLYLEHGILAHGQITQEPYTKPENLCVLVCNIPQRLLAFPGAAHRGQVFSAVVWRDAGDVDDLHVLLPDAASGGISLLARLSENSSAPQTRNFSRHLINRHSDCSGRECPRVAYPTDADVELEARRTGTSGLAVSTIARRQFGLSISIVVDDRPIVAELVC